MNTKEPNVSFCDIWIVLRFSYFFADVFVVTLISQIN